MFGVDLLDLVCLIDLSQAACLSCLPPDPDPAELESEVLLDISSSLETDIDIPPPGPGGLASFYQ